MRLLVTGGLGFIGSHFCEIAHADGTEILVYDKVTYAADLDFKARINKMNGVGLVVGDICDQELLTRAMKDCQADWIVHFAAESSVDKSIHEGTNTFVDANVQGTVSVLEVATDLQKPLLYVSTDEIYGMLGPKEDPWTESLPRKPRNPYAATKAAGEMLVEAYANTFGTQYVITRSSNNFGPRQHKEKFMPTIISALLSGQQVPIYGDGMQCRDWLYVRDNATAIYKLVQKPTFGEIYNIGGPRDIPNLEIVAVVGSILRDKGHTKKALSDMITFVPDRPGHDRRYSLDTTKISSVWAPETKFGDALLATIDYYHQKHQSGI